jgi:hypothetical protein
MSELKSTLFATLWTIFLIAFVGIGWKRTPIPIGFRYEATDSRLLTLGLSNPSVTIENAIANFSPRDPILFVAPSKQGSMYVTISYLSWPRKVLLPECNRPGLPPVQPRWAPLPPEQLKIAGVMFLS